MKKQYFKPLCYRHLLNNAESILGGSTLPGNPKNPTAIGDFSGSHYDAELLYGNTSSFVGVFGIGEDDTSGDHLRGGF